MTIKNNKMRLSMLIITILMVLTSLFSTVNSTSHSVEADLDPASKIICMFEDGEVLVNFYATDYFHYLFRSKSAVTSTEDVRSNWLNKLLGITGFDFNETNETILGRPLNPSDVPETSISEANANAPKVSAFDRFGMAGLKWSSYQGEWKYYHINACASVDRVSPTTYGTFYDGRLEPQSTLNEVSTSIDPRSIQFNKGVGSSLATAFTDTLSNGLFYITKIIVTLTIVFVGFAFTDLTTILGLLSPEGEGGGTASSVFTQLFDGIFSGFVIFTFVITGVYILYKGLIRRELRFALNTLIKTILIFIVAIVMASNPSYWIGIPNKVASYGQALVLNSMSGLYEDDDEAALCSTEVASINEGVNIDYSNPDSFKNEFEKTSENMRSMIGCQMWETLLFKPWVRGQFGAEFEELAHDQVNIDNESWVGTAPVPLGNDKTVDNWALFHLSTQTNAHAPYGPDSLPIIVNGVNSDWWRIADAMSNYEEEVVFESDENSVQHEFSIPVEKEPTKFWQSWIGNNRGERLGVAFTSIVFGIVGSVAPLVFGIASAVYGLGITLLMMASPIFLLLGTWGGRGDRIFLGWLSTLVNTIIKKIGAGLLLVLSLSFSLIIMNMVSDIGFIKALMLMIVVTMLLIKNKDKLLDMLAGVDFGGAFDPREKANRFKQATNRTAKEVGRVGASALAGGVAAHKTGQNVFRGVRTGVQRQLMNQLYTSSAGMNIIRQADISEGGEKLTRHTCVMCHMPLGVKTVETAYHDGDGNYFCEVCADEIGVETLHAVVVGNENKRNKAQEREDLLAGKKTTAPLQIEDIRSIEATSQKSSMKHRTMRERMNARMVNGEYTWDNEGVKHAITNNLKNLTRDYVIFSNVQMRVGLRANPPSPPEPLHEYIDLALINMAWNSRNFEVIEATYKEAWKRWYKDNSQHIEGLSEEEIEEFLKEIDNHSYDVDEKEALELEEEYMDKSQETDTDKERKIYVYVNGKLVLNNIDIEESDELLSKD